MTGAAYPKRLRLREPAQFGTVFNGAELRLSAGEILLLARRNALSHPRLGIVIGRKVCRHAVRRNRFKRAVRESYRLHQAGLHGLDIVILARSGVAGLELRELRERIASLWVRLGKRLSASPPSPASSLR